MIRFYNISGQNYHLLCNIYGLICEFLRGQEPNDWNAFLVSNCITLSNCCCLKLNVGSRKRLKHMQLIQHQFLGEGRMCEGKGRVWLAVVSALFRLKNLRSYIRFL